MSNDNGRHIFFVDDEQRVNRIISDTLVRFDFQVTCFTRASVCLAQLHEKRCDLLITDLRLPEMDGLELLRRAKTLVPWMPVLVVTGYGDIPTAVECIKAGAADFIEKPLDRQRFIRKVRSILQENGAHSNTVLNELTSAEKRVLKLVLDGRSSRDIAQLLNRSKRTIEAHRANVMRKLGAENLIELVKRAHEIGLIKTKMSCRAGQRKQSKTDRTY
jgi:two-component system response regulator FixJ